MSMKLVAGLSIAAQAHAAVVESTARDINVQPLREQEQKVDTTELETKMLVGENKLEGGDELFPIIFGHKNREFVEEDQLDLDDANLDTASGQNQVKLEFSEAVQADGSSTEATTTEAPVDTTTPTPIDEILEDIVEDASVDTTTPAPPPPTPHQLLQDEDEDAAGTSTPAPPPPKKQAATTTPPEATESSDYVDRVLLQDEQQPLEVELESGSDAEQKTVATTDGADAVIGAEADHSTAGTSTNFFAGLIR